MKLTKQIRLLLFVGPALLVVSLLAALWVANKNVALEDKAINKVQKVQEALAQGKRNLVIVVANLQNKIAQRDMALQGFDATPEPVGAYLEMPRGFEETLRDNTDIVNQSTVNRLHNNLNNIQKLGDELLNRLGNIEDLEDEQDNLESIIEGLYNDRLKGVEYVNALKEFDELQAQTQAAAEEIQAQKDSNRSTALLLLGIGGALQVVLLIFLLLVVDRSVHKPFERLFARMETRQPIRVEGNEVGRVAGYLNRLHMEQKMSEQVLEQFAQGAYRDEFNDDAISERAAASFITLRNRFREMDDALRAMENEMKRARAELEQKTVEVDRVKQALEVEQMNRRRSGLQVELTPDGTYHYANNLFLEALGYKWRELRGLDFWELRGRGELEDDYKHVVDFIKKGQDWQGELRMRAKDGENVWLSLTGSPVEDVMGNVTAIALVGADVTLMRKQISQAQREVDDKQQELNTMRRSQETFLAEMDEALAKAKLQGELEKRLVQQQTALQELTRNPALKGGEVREALRSVTETLTYAADVDRSGLWLFTDQLTQLRCIDVFERTGMSHSEGLALIAQAVPAFAANVQTDEVLAAHAAKTDPRTQELTAAYLQPHGIEALLTAPVRLGGNVVGFLMLEAHQVREWKPDEENFLLAIAELVSLALEQGNRRAMEEELRMTLEESQALEEELRQNAEEIEATNEEMRRTQIELRGQINALNNAAIVAETNLQGRITYANAEFAKVYGFNSADIRGKTHKEVNSGHHRETFWAEMWRAISAGKVWKAEVLNRTQTGEQRWIYQTVTPVLGLDGKPYKYIAVGFDVTDQKNTEAKVQAVQQQVQSRELQLQASSEEMLRTQIELAGQLNALNNSSMVYETDMEGKIQYANDAFLSAMGMTHADLIGQHFTELKSPNQPENVFEAQGAAILRGEIWKGELEFRNAHGESFWVLLTTTPVVDETGTPLKCIHVLADVTAQKQQEFRLKQQQQAIIELTRHPDIKDGDLEAAFATITQTGLDTMRVSRVALWLFEDDDTKVRCVAVAQRGAHQHGKGTVLERGLYPAYFKTIESDRLLASDDPQNDDRLRELAFTILKPSNVTATLDVAILYGAKMVGFLSIEHTVTARHWTLDEISFGNSLADTVGLVMEQRQRKQTDKLREAYQQLEYANEEMIRQKQELEETAGWLTESIKYAKRIQQNILPDKADIRRSLGNYFIVFRPKDIVGGDFYWFSRVDDNQAVMIVADGTGHGVPGAFLTMIGYMILNQIVNEKRIIIPSEILYHLHVAVRVALKQDEDESSSRDGMDVAVSLINTDTLEVQYAGANLPFYIYQDWEIKEIKPTKKSIGGEQLEEERTFENHEFQLKPGDAIYMYTDGFVDQLGGPEEKRFSKRRFRDLVLRTQHESMKTQRALLNLEWKDWKDDREQLDDVTVFGMKF